MTSASLGYTCFARRDLEKVLAGEVAVDETPAGQITERVAQLTGRDRGTVQSLMRGKLRRNGDRVLIAGTGRRDDIIVTLRVGS